MQYCLLDFDKAYQADTTTETGQLVRSVRKIIKTSAKDAASVMGRNLGCDVSKDEGMRGGMQGKCRL